MNSTAVLSFLAAGLQLTIPSYALRLVGRFGAQRVGWFVTLAFSALALLYAVKPLKPMAAGGGDMTMDLVYALACGLLLIGMSHLETLCSEREHAKREEQRQRRTWETEARAEAAELAQVNQELTEKLSRCEQREIALRESEAQYRFLFADNPLPMCIFDLRTGRFLAVNQATLRQYGFTQPAFLALTARDLLPAEAGGAFGRDTARPCFGVENRGLWQHRRQDGTLLEVEVTAVDLKFAECPARLIVANDVTARRRQEREARQAEKLEAVGRVAGGVAHHFNNLLTIIDGHANLLLLKPQEPKATEQLKHISTAATRAAGLTRQLLAASGHQNLEPELLELDQLLPRLSHVVRHLIGEHIIFQTNFDSQLPPIMADPHAVEHVLVNLVLNARDAMTCGGTLALSTSRCQLDSAGAELHPGVKPGEFVCLAVHDTGCGISPEVQARLFEPFVTTRDVGRATGLGLASVYGTVKQHGGWLDFSTRPGDGTECRVFFPAAPAQESKPLTSALQATILLVEPDERLRSVARYILNRHHYRVLEVDSAATALAIWDGQAAKVDLLLTDLHLSADLSGRELAQRLQQAKPGLKVAYTAGQEPVAEGAEPDPVYGLDLVPKPFTPERLLQAVESTLAGSASV